MFSFALVAAVTSCFNLVSAAVERKTVWLQAEAAAIFCQTRRSTVVSLSTHENEKRCHGSMLDFLQILTGCVLHRHGCLHEQPASHNANIILHDDDTHITSSLHLSTHRHILLQASTQSVSSLGHHRFLVGIVSVAVRALIGRSTTTCHKETSMATTITSSSQTRNTQRQAACRKQVGEEFKTDSVSSFQRTSDRRSQCTKTEISFEIPCSGVRQSEASRMAKDADKRVGMRINNSSQQPLYFFLFAYWLDNRNKPWMPSTAGS
jgi:hypothetical protein